MSKRSLMPAKVYYESGIAAAEAGMERKQIAGLESWSSASRQDGSNFRSNMVTLAEYQDSGAVGSAGVLGLAAAWACVNLLAGTIASLPLMVYRTGRDGRRHVATRSDKHKGVLGKVVYVRVDSGGSRILKKKNSN